MVEILTGEVKLVDVEPFKVADRLHEQLKTLFDKASEFVGTLGVEVCVYKLSGEYMKILYAGRIYDTPQRAEGIYHLFMAPRDNTILDETTERSPKREKRRESPIHGRRCKHPLCLHRS